VSVSPAWSHPDYFMERTCAGRHSLAKTETIDDMNLAFVQESFVYDYLRPRRNLLASCVLICRRASHAGKRNAPRT
jgi:hypothetical protein